jgi:hypothetical protein
MALSKIELDQIHLRRLASPNKKYYGDDEKVYIGTSDRRLRLLNDADKINFNPTDTIPDRTIQLAIERVDAKLKDGVGTPITSKDSSYTMLYTDGIIQVTTGANNVTIRLPDTSTTSYILDGVIMQRIYQVVKIDNGSGKVRLVPFSTEKILGETEQWLKSQYDNFTFYTNGSNYFER